MRAPIYILSALGLTNVVFGFSCIGQDPRLCSTRTDCPKGNYATDMCNKGSLGIVRPQKRVVLPEEAGLIQNVKAMGRKSVTPSISFGPGIASDFQWRRRGSSQPGG
ncbi:hypothetical protein DL95DRAFT_402658 [Leptodontidium sp. 2 PMI_412]|nr:hypothetical protein DL95DRAFT_402658 [Leptodontidium sp. 2 PMI_412]